jgi:hypothetical protein
MDNDFERWMQYAEWRGQTVQALRDITQELKEIKTVDLKEIKNEITDIKRCNLKRDIRTAEIAGGTSMLVIMLGWLISSILAAV